MISSGRLGARPQKNDAKVKPVTEAMRSRLRPKRFASHPVIGRMIAFATRYDVSAQVASSGVADRFPAMCGNETLTTVVSSTSMNVPNITATAMSQGLTDGVDTLEFMLGISCVMWEGTQRHKATKTQRKAASKNFYCGLSLCLRGFVSLCSFHFTRTFTTTDIPGRSWCSLSC